MSDEQQQRLKGERPGGLWDWPVGVILAGVFLAAITGAVNVLGLIAGVLIALFGVLSLMIRRGAFKSGG
jgi:hypothetical protein